MPNYEIPISYVVGVTVTTPQAGLEPLQMGTLLLLTEEEPAQELEGNYLISRTATGVSNVWGTETLTAKAANAVFAQTPNILTAGGYVIVAQLQDEETLATAIDRLAKEIYFEGVITLKDTSATEYEAASTAVEAMKDRVLFVYSHEATALTAQTGLFAKLSTNQYTKCLLYTQGEDATTQKLNSKLFACAYASKGMSVDYTGSNTTITMNLKDLSGLVADTNISETTLLRCAQLGVDCFPSIAGLAKVVSNKSKMFFDQVVNLIWFGSTVQRECFNVFATTNTKIAQTEEGMSLLKSAIIRVCEQAVTNRFLAPGTWNSPDTFGNLADFHRNIEEFGYYVYSQPIAKQLQSERKQRKAPLIQIAGKEAGAIHSANIIVNIEE